jgi:hypothetical protein
MQGAVLAAMLCRAPGIHNRKMFLLQLQLSSSSACRPCTQELMPASYVYCGDLLLGRHDAAAAL